MEPIKDIDPNPPVDTEIDVKPSETEKKPAEVEAAAEEDGAVTIEVDGKSVTLTKAEVAEHYKSGLRLVDYTKKTMEAAEVKKSASVEQQKAQQERQQYAQNLNRIANQIEGVLQEQQQTDMNALLASDPVEYLKQQHLFNQRQAKLNEVNQHRQQLAAQQQADSQQAYQAYLAEQQQALLAKLPAWKDDAKAAAERSALRTYLKAEGYDDRDVASISDNRAVVMARKAMLYDQMLSKASAAAKKVAPLPQKVERPGVNETPSTDKRSSAFQRLSKSGRVEDAAALFSALL